MNESLAPRLPEYLEGRTPKKKRPFLFQKKESPARKSGKKGAFFFGVRRVCEAGGGAESKRTIWFQVTTCSARAIRHTYEFLIK